MNPDTQKKLLEVAKEKLIEREFDNIQVDGEALVVDFTGGTKLEIKLESRPCSDRLKFLEQRSIVVVTLNGVTIFESC